jgi:hypothetical protein
MGGAPLREWQIIDAARAAGVTLSVDGGSLLLRSGSPAPQELIDALSWHNSEVIDLLQSDPSGWLAEDWRAFFNEWAAIAEFDGALPRHKAEARAFGACVCEWLNRNPARLSPGRCLGCGHAEHPHDPLLPFGTESSGHAWLHSCCWPAWHSARRAAAIAALAAMGIDQPRPHR